MKNNIQRSGSSGILYGMGLIGAMGYFIAKAVGFWMSILGFFKALFWPAFMVYHILSFFNA